MGIPISGAVRSSTNVAHHGWVILRLFPYSFSQSRKIKIVRLKRRRGRGMEIVREIAVSSFSSTTTPRTTPTSVQHSLVRRATYGVSRIVTFLRPTQKRSFNERRREIQEAQSRHLRGNETQTQAVFRLRERPSARRGPGIVSVDRNVRSKCRCSCVLQFTR